MKTVTQYITYKKGFENFHNIIESDFQKNLLVLAFLLQDNDFCLDRLIEDLKDMSNIGQKCFDMSHIYYEKSDDTIEVMEIMGYEDVHYSDFVASRLALVSIVERWKDMRFRKKQFLLMVLDSDNYVDFVTFDTQQEVDEYIKMHYRGECLGGVS